VIAAPESPGGGRVWPPSERASAPRLNPLMIGGSIVWTIAFPAGTFLCASFAWS